MASKVDFKKELKQLYSAKNKPEIVKVPELKYLMIDGMGSPGEAKEYLDSISVLYPVAFITKFMSKLELKKDYTVPPLEGLWWADNMNDFTEGRRDKWKWTLMIMQPSWITKEMIKKSINKAKEKNSKISNLIDKLRLENYEEGKTAQIMHSGLYKEEAKTIQILHDFIKESKGEFDGHKEKHHEIYLTDPRKCKPEKMKTILRQPFK